MNKLSNDIAVSTIHIILPDIEILDEVNKWNQKILVKCKVCGRKWITKYPRLYYGHGCAKCAGIAKLSNDDFLNKVKINAHFVTILTDYVNSRTAVRCLSKRAVKPIALAMGI